MVYSSLVHAAAHLARRVASYDEEPWTEEQCVGHPITHDVHYPGQGDTVYTGEQITLSWQSDFNVTGKLTQKWSAEIRDFTNMSFPEAWRYQIFSNVTFNYPSDDWTLWNRQCEEYWTLIERNWTIPEDLDLKSGKFAVIFRNETNPANRTSVFSDLFFIENNKTSTTTAPTQTVTVTIATPAATNGGSETTESTPAPTNDGGLSSGVKTGISVGVAALTTLLLLGL
ncbi:hypothetical protein NCS57_01014900 [Fusarium keratoplasticum]|uniref:Uncharacterized protein n=1 Tax=Fusarium keratoplasticum TaxID=1328300 RepID=A0ACC0QQP0_9HYPO|nr:hypothetical protein NCS57_01014900 [Fusarium keratoplasticum]KAI8660379.1 hypothetical protein NCS57_01014900 [Fusarium keratoplasticum]KAI8661406.1 hypothetical protein NCS55_01010800 [Fusarium keratoplasticum]